MYYEIFKMEKTMSETIVCAYCGTLCESTLEAVSAHMLNCDKRPEAGLQTKIAMLEIAGDEMLSVIHRLVKAQAEIEGMRTTVWQIYAMCKNRWERIKSVDVKDII